MRPLMLVLLAATLMSGPVYAQRIDPLLDEARAAYNNGDSLKTVTALKTAVLQVWDQVPLTIQNAYLVADKKTYAQRTDNVYAPNEPILITCQLLGYRIKQIGAMHTIRVNTDFYLLDMAGKVLGGLQEFGKFEHKGPIPTTDFRLDLNYEISDLPPGEYQIQTVIRDVFSGKTTRFTKRIQIRS